MAGKHRRVVFIENLSDLEVYINKYNHDG